MYLLKINSQEVANTYTFSDSMYVYVNARGRQRTPEDARGRQRPKKRMQSSNRPLIVSMDLKIFMDFF